jgi:hypothetical protein
MALLPTSNALAEASPDSLSELFSRDPEQCTPEDDDKIILVLREQRARYMAAEASGARAPRLVKAPQPLPVVDDPDELRI